MDWRSLAQDVDLARSRVEALRMRDVEPSRSTGSSADLAERAFAELDTVFEELAVAQQALREQAEEVVAARRALTDQDWAYRQLLSADGTGFLSTTLEGLIVEVNLRVGTMLELEPRFLSRKPLASFVPVSERAGFRRRLIAIGRAGRGPHTWTQSFAPRGGRVVECQVSVVRCHTPVSPLLFWRLVPTRQAGREDGWPPARIQSEIDRQTAERTHELEQRDRRKDEFLAMLSHEMRTPLNVISGYASMLRTGTLTEQSAAKAIAAIERNAALQTKLVADLLDVTRIAAGHLSLTMQPLDFRVVVEAAAESAHRSIHDKQLDFTMTPCERPLPVMGDDKRLQQVVTNLLANAVKFTPVGGSVIMTLAPRSGHAILTVRDTGIGIRPEFVCALFERFTQDHDDLATRAHGGLGLGLSIVKHIVELHHGTVSAESPGPGQGATFTVTLPLLDA